VKREREEEGGMGHGVGKKKITKMLEKVEAMFFEI